MAENATQEAQSEITNTEKPNNENSDQNDAQNESVASSKDNKEDLNHQSNDNADDNDSNEVPNDKDEKQTLITEYAETQITRSDDDDDDDTLTAESQPNFENPHGLTGLVRKKKVHKKIEPIKLDDIPSWADYAPSIYEGKHLPKQEDLIFPPNDSINHLISYIPRGDSTILAVDAIVNAANSGLYAGGGICGAIHSAAGPELEEACMKIGGCKTGDAVITPGFDLPAKNVIHAVGPIGQHPEELKSAYQKTLEFIDGTNVRSVALCCISTGIYGYPIRPATKIALRTVREFLENEENQKKVDRIIFVVFNHKDCNVYENLLSLYFPLPEGAIKGAEGEDINEEEEEEEEEEDYPAGMHFIGDDDYDEESPEVDYYSKGNKKDELDSILSKRQDTEAKDEEKVYNDIKDEEKLNNEAKDDENQNNEGKDEKQDTENRDDESK